MEFLPQEILEKVLSDPKLTIEDVVNVASTSHYFRSIILGNNAIWRQKFWNKWPQLNEYDFELECDNYFAESQFVYDLRRRIMAVLEAMPAKFYKTYELSDSDLQEWDGFLNEKPHLYYYLVDYLIEIVSHCCPINSIELVPLNTPGNKTLQYYAQKVLKHVQQLHLSQVWAQYVALPEKLQLLEIGATIVAQWCQPNLRITHKNIAKKLEEIADQVKMRLRDINPDHALFKVSEGELARWRVERLMENHYSRADCKELMLILREVFYGSLGYGDSAEEICILLYNRSLINKVLENRRGLPITLAIIYESIGRRLGLHFEPISYPEHFLLRFIETEEPSKPKIWNYIDAFNGASIVRTEACPHHLTRPKQLYPEATPLEVVERIANNLKISSRTPTHPNANGRINKLRTILELLKLVSPQDLSALVALAKLYMLHNMNTRSLEHYLATQKFAMPEQADNILQMLRDYSSHNEQRQNELMLNKVEVAQRTGNLKFAVGMVMSHSTLNYKCVIYDWDPICLATAAWQAEMNVHKLQLKNEQPFYNVLVEDGSCRYVAQENLTPTDDLGSLYLNEDLGRHFSHFFENHYVPNAEKEKEYPADKKVRYKYYHELVLTHFKPV